jgi:hypothetical protein
MTTQIHKIKCKAVSIIHSSSHWWKKNLTLKPEATKRVLKRPKPKTIQTTKKSSFQTSIALGEQQSLSHRSHVYIYPTPPHCFNPCTQCTPLDSVPFQSVSILSIHSTPHTGQPCSWKTLENANGMFRCLQYARALPVYNQEDLAVSISSTIRSLLPPFRQSVLFLIDIFHRSRRGCR